MLFGGRARGRPARVRPFKNTTAYLNNYVHSPLDNHTCMCRTVHVANSNSPRAGLRSALRNGLPREGVARRTTHNCSSCNGRVNLTANRMGRCCRPNCMTGHVRVNTIVNTTPHGRIHHRMPITNSIMMLLNNGANHSNYNNTANSSGRRAIRSLSAYNTRIRGNGTLARHGVRHLFHHNRMAALVGHYGSFNTNNMSITVNRLASNMSVGLSLIPGGCTNLSNARLTVSRSRRHVTYIVSTSSMRTFGTCYSRRGLRYAIITRMAGAGHLIVG